jgi:hypothetical protein
MRSTGKFYPKAKGLYIRTEKKETYSGGPEQSVRFHNTDSFNLQTIGVTLTPPLSELSGCDRAFTVLRFCRKFSEPLQTSTVRSESRRAPIKGVGSSVHEP